MRPESRILLFLEPLGIDEKMIALVEVAVIDEHEDSAGYYTCNYRSGINFRHKLSGNYRVKSDVIEEIGCNKSNVRTDEKLRTVLMEACKTESCVDLENTESNAKQTVNNVNRLNTLKNGVNKLGVLAASVGGAGEHRECIDNIKYAACKK